MQSEFLPFAPDETSVSGPPIDADAARMVAAVRATTFNGAKGDDPKALGAFYTDAQVAEFLVWWGIRSETDSVMDPSFGGGVFLRAASKRLLRLGGAPTAQVRGVEVDADVFNRIRDKLHDEFGTSSESLVQGNFFSLVCSKMAPVDVVVGNPPFIRYQRFAGEVRSLAFARASEQGVRLSELSSSWVPFLIHSAGLLRRGGRLAMVIPFEVCHAGYAVPVLDYLARTFREVTFLTFRKKLFPDLSEDTLLLLAEDKGPHRSTRFCVRDLANAGELAAVQAEDRRPIRGARLLNAIDVASGAERLIESVLPKKATDLYRELRSSHAVRRLGEVADVGIGYVTGANDFFHLSAEDAKRWQIPPNFLKKAVRRGRDLSGLRFTLDDWSKSYGHSQAAYLLPLLSGYKSNRINWLPNSFESFSTSDA